MFSQDYTPEESKKIIQSAINRKHTVLLVGSCTITYAGRASSTLGEGERIVIIKGDGTFIVHRGWGSKPVNWQPAGSMVFTSNTLKHLLIRVLRNKPRESIRVEFNSLSLIEDLNLIDKANFRLQSTELDMQQAVILHPEIFEVGFHPMESEKRVESGFIDLFGYDKKDQPVILEFKRDQANVEAVDQLHRYVKEVTFKRKLSNLRGVLVASSLTKQAKIKLKQLGMEFKRLTPKECSKLLENVESIKLTDFHKKE